VRFPQIFNTLGGETMFNQSHYTSESYSLFYALHCTSNRIPTFLLQHAKLGYSNPRLRIPSLTYYSFADITFV